MNLDRLKKLVKLANHNPNDNEANSAARRVCKMIEDGKFEFGAIPPAPVFNGMPTQKQPKTYNDIHRSRYNGNLFESVNLEQRSDIVDQKIDTPN